MEVDDGPRKVLEIPEGDLVVFDVDSTLLNIESLEEAAYLVGGNRLRRLFEGFTQLSTEGELGFSASLAARIDALTDRRLSRTHVQMMARSIARDDNITESVLRSLPFIRHNAKLRRIMCITGSFHELIYELIKRLGIPRDLVIANRFKWRRGRVMGHQRSRLASQDDPKLKILKDLRKRGKIHGRVVMVGDSVFDINAAIKTRKPPADLAIAFTEVHTRDAVSRALSEHPHRVKAAHDMPAVIGRLSEFFENNDHSNGD